jgi:hypothetical protein
VKRGEKPKQTGGETISRHGMEQGRKHEPLGLARAQSRAGNANAKRAELSQRGVGSSSRHNRK